jgi:general secretion pathway protein L
VGQAVAALSRAWKGELGAVARERLSFLADVAHVFIDVRADTLTVVQVDANGSHTVGRMHRDERAAGELKRLLARAGGGLDVTLRIDVSLVLRPTVRMPLASRQTLKRALAFELERLTPTDPAELYFDFVVQKRHAHLADVTLRVVHRAVLDDVIRVIHEAGALVANIDFAGDSVPCEPAAFPVDGKAWFRARWRRLGNYALAALAACLFVAVIGAGELRGEWSIDALNEEVAQAATQAQAVQGTKHRIESANARMAWLVGQRQRPLFVATLAELSRVLPDGTWLQELSVEGPAVHASGSSRNATDLLALIDRSGSFRNAQFAAPVMRNPSDGTDRFELTFEARPQ